MSKKDKQPQKPNDREDRLVEARVKKLKEHLKKERKTRNQLVAKVLGISKDLARGFLKKRVEAGLLVEVNGEDNVPWYFINKASFYTPEELFELLPEKERKRILGHLGDEPIGLSEVAHLLYGNEERGSEFLETFFNYFIGLGLVRFVKKDAAYVLTERGEELGVDAQSIKTLEAVALENALFVKEEKAGKVPKTLKEVKEAIKRDVKNKTVQVLDLREEVKDEDLKFVFIGEVLYGSQHTDQELLERVLDAVGKPTLIITSGLVQGRFEVKNKAKTRMLAEEGGLHRIEAQFHSAGMLLEWMERIATSRVCVIQSDDDWRLAEDYSNLAYLAEGKNPWQFGVDFQSFSAEMKRRLGNKELREKMRIQWEIIQSYMYRIGRSLLNKDEVKAKINVRKSEYRLIMEIMIAKRKNFDYPKEYEKVVNVDALYGNLGKRIVSPDPLRLLVAPNKEVRFVHNAGFSDITQYQEVNQHLDAVARHLGLSKNEVPWILADFHQEKFFAQYLMGTWIMNMPGMQNTMPAAALTMKEWHTRILDSKERRQSRVRKEPASPSAPEITFCRDGRIRFRILNNAIMKVIEEQKDEPEKREVMVVGTDTQFGSITNWPELVAKFFDYGLYARKASTLIINGDFIHGNIYPQHTAESRDMRLTSLHAQKIFSFKLTMPLFLSAPNLKEITAWLGNHEWNNFDAKRSGDSPLTFLETGFMAVLMERKRAGIQTRLEKAMTVSRIRWENTHNPQGDIINWPFYANSLCGFKIGIQHMWQPFAGKNPANEGQKWLKNMARNASEFDILVGGDKHSVWMAELGDKVVVQAGASASQSGYELARGLMSTVMFTLIEFSNRDGITVEFVPWQFLMNYEFQCPEYRGKDAEFVRPAKGTDEYRRGKMAPYIERMIDNLTGYLPI